MMSTSGKKQHGHMIKNWLLFREKKTREVR